MDAFASLQGMLSLWWLVLGTMALPPAWVLMWPLAERGRWETVGLAFGDQTKDSVWQWLMSRFLSLTAAGCMGPPFKGQGRFGMCWLLDAFA